jgi:hypothetical protein
MCRPVPAVWQVERQALVVRREPRRAPVQVQAPQVQAPQVHQGAAPAV